MAWGLGGGGIAHSGTNITIRRNTIVYNDAYRGGGILSGLYEPDSTVAIKENVVYGNNAILGGNDILDSLAFEYGTPDNIPYILFYSFLSQPEYCGINGNICADPLFADPNNNDYHLKSQAGRWDPNSQSWVKDDVTSLCIDAGDPASPIGLEPFPNGGIINMGAYGGTVEASKSYFGKPVCETIVAGDINGDCKVDFKDFALMAFHWLEEIR